MIHKDAFDGNLVFGGKKFHLETNRKPLVTGAADVDEYARYDIDVHADTSPVDRCLVCGARRFDTLLRKINYRVICCLRCGTGYPAPRPLTSGLKKVYRSRARDYKQSHENAAAVSLDRVKYRYFLEQADRFAAIGSVLEIGSGIGLFCEAAAARGVRRVEAVEQSEYMWKGSLFYPPGMPIHAGIEKVGTAEGGFDAVAMFCVLEHILDFNGYLDALKRVMHCGSLLLVEVPNLMSLASRLIRAHSPCFNIEHVTYFCMKSLTMLLKRCGFAVLHRETVISEISNVRNYLSFKEPYLSDAEVEDCFDFVTADWIHANELGSRLFVIARLETS